MNNCDKKRNIQKIKNMQSCKVINQMSFSHSTVSLKKKVMLSGKPTF